MVVGFLVALPLCANAQTTSADSLTRKVDTYVKPYLDLAAFSGAVLIARHDTILLERAYGTANYELGVPNRTDTRFHIASVSKTFRLSSSASHRPMKPSVGAWPLTFCR